MITYLNLGFNGRLGNQLFQYAAIKAAAFKNNFILKLPNLNDRTWHGQKCLLNNFNLNYELITEDDIKNIKYFIQEPSDVAGKYTSILEHVEDFSSIDGFFQNTKYFINFKKQIDEEISIKKSILDKEQIFIDKIRNNYPLLVSLHIRTGDMLDGTNPIYNKYYGSSPFDQNSIFGNYINKCISYYDNKKTKFLVFVGGSRSGNDIKDINWAQSFFTDKKFLVNSSNNPIKDLARISLCDDNIVSFSSTFSWWGAYLNKNVNKKIFCPKNFHFDEMNKYREGFYPTDWIQI